MALHYYLNLPKDRHLNFETNKIVSDGIMRTATNNLKPFETYLGTVIRVLESMEAIKAKWEKVKTANIAELKIKGSLYAIPKQTVIHVSGNEKGSYRIVSEIDEPDFKEKLKYKAGNKKGEITVLKEDIQKRIIKLPIVTEKFDKVLWGFNDISLEPAWPVFMKGRKISEYTISSVQSDKLTLAGSVKPKETLSYDGKELNYTIKSETQRPSGRIIRDDPDRYIVYNENNEKPLDNAKIHNKLISFIDIGNLRFDNGKSLDIEGNEGLTITLKNSGDYGKTVISNNIKFTIENIRKNSRDAWWIQLSELDDTAANDDVSGLSPLRYFFDDEVSVEDNKKNEYQIDRGLESENKLVLRKKNDKGCGDFCFPEGETLSVKVNTYQLEKQFESIWTLKNMPVGEQAKLIQLFEKREAVRWETPKNERVTEWYVITDSKRNGYEQQIKFVEQALNTPDFAILEGPPGSGKTTVILELICQLAKRGKRALLCGSTHVAIDNILERLKEKRPGSESLLEQCHILPIRIGDEKRINEDVREFQLNNLIKSKDIQNLLLDAANLVCGTTIGILQHPKFKQRKSWWEKNKYKGYHYSSDTPIVPEFDCLIIDESSKTTFQEFLIPALYAKKWILAGDVMQLSPFTERANIVSNIESLLVAGKPLDPNLQLAVFYLQKLKNCIHKNNRFVLPVPMEIMQSMLSELEYGRNTDFMKNNKLLFFIATARFGGNYEENIQIRTFGQINSLELAVADIIFIEKARLQEVVNTLPERHAVLQSKSWIGSDHVPEHAFRYNFYQKTHPFDYREKGKEFSDGFEITGKINQYFSEKNWAEEVAWRIDREHQLRLKEQNKTKEKLTNAIEEFIPVSLKKEDVEDALNSIAVMAFPSILESLIQGIKGRTVKKESTITEGFRPEDIDKRKTTLVYQHRMHPDISRFPREQFYSKENALQDIGVPSIADARQWGYNCYKSRSVWVNVEGKTMRNYNEEEVKVLIEHLKRFIEYAKKNEQPEKKNWTVACLTFYRGQETKIRERLQHLTSNENGVSNFTVKDGKDGINIKLHTVDKFQGHEADVVFLSMVQTSRVGFMDNPNRLNVAITRAKFQLVIIGKRKYFSEQSDSDDLQKLATNTCKYGET